MESNFAGPKQLAAISNHSGTIHAVRFSGNNKYLASGADDKIVCVYSLDPNPPSHGATFGPFLHYTYMGGSNEIAGTNEPPPVENWRVIRRLIGHDNDVQDVGWSHDSSILISVGLDSKVVIWSGHTFEKLKTLSQHQSHVKGITFDPANKYFATASDDRTIKIYRWTPPPPNATAHDQVNNFILEQSIQGPFASSPLTTYFRRCSWSPDGNHIGAANATNGPVSSVAIIDRGTWDSNINLIGHEGPVEVCTFSPRMFFREPVSKEQLEVHGHNIPSVTVIACAGQDKALSVWNTSYARPFLIAHDVATKAISDLAWAPDGETLFLCSLDGSIQAAVFEPGELGYAAPVQENEKSLSRYGAGRKAGVVEGTDALLLEESSKAGELKGVQGRMGELMGDHGPGINGSTEHPRTNGITNGIPPEPVPAVNGQEVATIPQQPPSDPRVDKLKQRVEITKDGKKRIRPLLVSSSSGLAESSLPQTQLVPGGTQGRAGPSDAPRSTIDLSKPYDGFPKGGLAALMVGNKRKFAEIEGDDERRTEKRLAAAVQNGAAPIVMNGADGLLPPRLATKPQDQSEAAAALRPAIINPALSVSQIRLAVPLVRSVIVRTIDGSEPPKDTADPMTDRTEETVILEARNAAGPSRTGRAQDRDPARINCTKQGQSLWQDYLPKPVLLLTGNQHLWAAACEDGSVHVWTPAGRRLLNAMVLEAAPIIMDCRGWWLMCISAVGQCYVWNIKTLSSPHPPISLAPVLDSAVHSQGPHLTSSPGIIFARLNTQGRIVVAMSDGGGYTYSPDMFIWQRLSEPWWAVGSQYWNTADGGVDNVKSSSKGGTDASGIADEVSPENISAGIIPLLERNTTNHTLLRGRAYFLQRLIKALLVAEGFEGFETGVSIAHLENRVAAAMTLGAREEFRVYLLMYAKRLGAEGVKGKIEELLRSLLGDIFAEEGKEVGVEEAEGKGWHTKGDKICGWDSQELLKEVVLILGK